MDKDYCGVTLKGITEVSEKGAIFKVELESKDMIPFEYVGYRDVHQLGRFYSLTINKKVTRLYTHVGFLDARNIELMEKTVFG